MKKKNNFNLNNETNFLNIFILILIDSWKTIKAFEMNNFHKLNINTMNSWGFALAHT
jgi:hypothetical protein